MSIRGIQYIARELTDSKNVFLWIFLGLFLIPGIYFATHIPIGYTNDEAAHVYRAYDVSRGNLVPKNYAKEGNLNLYGNLVPLSIIQLEQYTSAGIRLVSLCDQSGCNKPSHEQLTEARTLAQKPLSKNERYKIHFWGANPYIFVVYVPAAVGVGLAGAADLSTGHTVIAGRLTSLLFFAAISLLSLFIIRRTRIKWLLLSLALLPQTIVQATSIGADMILNATAFLLFAVMVRIILVKGPAPLFLKALLFTCAVLLPLIKLPYLILSLAVLFLPIYTKGRRGMYLRIITFLGITVPAILWNIFTADMQNTQSTLTNSGGTAPNLLSQLSFMLTHPLNFGGVLTGSFFSQDWFSELGILTQQGLRLPNILVMLSIFLLLLSASLAAKDFTGTSRRRMVMLLMIGTGVVSILGIIVALYGSYNPVGSPIIYGVQGRYLIPCLPFLFTGLALLVKHRFDVPSSGKYWFYALHAVILFSSIMWYQSNVYS